MEIIIIAAMAENRVIGKDNTLPWSLKADMARFKELTKGRPCIMGRKTWESLPNRPLPERPNIVISKSLPAAPGTVLLPSLQAAIEHCTAYEKIFICGGASVYREALAIADRIEMTVIHKQYDGDVFFPEIDSALWIETERKDFEGFSFVSYRRAGK